LQEEGDTTTSSQHRQPTSPSMTRYEPIPWSEAFSEREIVNVPSGMALQVYYATSGARDKRTLFCFHHGAGLSACSFAALVKMLCADDKQPIHVLSIDARGHGGSSDTSEWPLETLARDMAMAIQCSTHFSPDYDIILVGHSMGGAVVCEVASRKLLDNIVGLVLIDVTEGTAVESLPHMLGILKQRPESFATQHDAIRWSIRSKMLRNVYSARFSIPSVLVEENSDKALSSMVRWRWRTNVLATELFWKDWFEGLSDKFLAVSIPKLLILADSERLDTKLIVGQMQGRFQLEILPSGHHVHEDEPGRVAHLLLSFDQRLHRPVLCGK